VLVLGLGASAQASASAEKPSGPTFFKMPPIVLPIFDGAVVKGQASLVLALELAEGKTEDDVKIQRPRLVDAFMDALTRIYEERANAERVIDAAVVKPRLLDAADRVLGHGVVREVLIQQAFERGRRPR
jgi:hypothetical protein